MNKIFNFEDVHKFVSKELAEVDLLIKKLTEDKSPLIYLLTNHLINSGGKRIRPILTILCATLCNYNYQGSKHIQLAAAVEFIHTATLLHDDVIDESKLRRGLITANHQWGNKASILVGDFLLSQAFKIMVDQQSLLVLEILSNASAVIAHGEVMQLAAINNLKINEQDYFEIINAKTAELFAAACWVGAVSADANKEVQLNLASFGRYLGMTFQIIDDILDYVGDKNKLGKLIGDDFKEGKITLPIIIAYKGANDQEKNFWQRTMSELQQNDQDFSTVIKLFDKYQIINKATNIANDYANLAKLALNNFLDNPIKKILINIIDFSLRRIY